MNRRIGIIIATDFCCWIPFIVICALHFLAVLDATPWYSLFSMIILPINSVINPFLYDDVLTGFLRAPLRSISTRISNSRIYLSIHSFLSSASPEVIEMTQLEVGEGGAGPSAQDENVKTTEIGPEEMV